MGVKIRRALALLLALCVLFCVPAMAAKKPSKATVKKAYQTYIAKNLSGKKYEGAEVGYYDINKDGIEEMIFEYAAGVRCAFKIYTYSNKKVKKLHSGAFEGCGGAPKRIKGKKYIVLRGSNGWGDDWATVYKITNNKLKKVETYRVLAKQNVASGKITVKYYKNGKKCKKKVYTDFEKSLVTIPMHST